MKPLFSCGDALGGGGGGGWVVISHFNKKNGSMNQKSKSFTKPTKATKLFFVSWPPRPSLPTPSKPSSYQDTSDEYWDKELTHRPAQLRQFPNRIRGLFCWEFLIKKPGRFQQKTSIAKLIKKNCKTYFNKKCYLQAWAEKWCSWSAEYILHQTI